ncbi:phosphoribosyltransferase [Bacillus badius]|uniref:phosphoribosyltransferase n=1 Tax=Bacillus badius TaxID=1455 RepID=UPI002E22A8E0|nr:phosphoribosyltransferase [Bacillus badius]
MRKRTKYKKINATIFNKLGVLFDEKGWDMEEESNDVSLFGRFCEVLNRLNVEQQEFLIDLTYHYQKIEFNEYNTLICNILQKLNSEMKNFMNLTNLYVMPLLPEEDKNKIKSSTLVAYLFQTPQIKYMSDLSKKKFKVRSELTKKELNKVNESPNSMLLLVDDFIGTGETAMAAYKYYRDMGIKHEKIVIISLVSLYTGFNLVKENNIEIFSGKILKKAISDYYSEDELKLKLSLMQSIEDIIGSHADYKLGYKGSEALVTLIRTPNNTFPVYWLTKKGNNAPFPRGDG